MARRRIVKKMAMLRQWTRQRVWRWALEGFP